MRRKYADTSSAAATLKAERCIPQRIGEDMGLHGQMIGGDARGGTAVHLEACERRARPYPDAVQCYHRPSRGKGSRRCGAFEIDVQPAQWPSPKIPLVDVAEQGRGSLQVGPEPIQELLDLPAPFRGTQAEVRRHHAKHASVTAQPCLDGAARLAAGHADIDAAPVEDIEAGEQGVAVVTLSSHEGG